MAKIKVYYDRAGKTLTVWFDEPTKEYICEETGEEVILMKDKKGKVIGFERLNFVLEEEEAGFAFEAVAI
ncbi:MAG TPA: DUF2283 domain-containing protein [Candidatus Tripitaka californicus]|uniref:DUF2283 domain-containing protein n=1 Tax=Candidatus Tripitaka californicus TaxID=3367616 RepID=UPI0040263C0A